MTTNPADDENTPLQNAADLSPQARDLLDVSSQIPVEKECGSKCQCDC